MRDSEKVDVAAAVTSSTGRLAAYMVRAPRASLPKEVAVRATHHLLDTLAAMASGTTLPVGRWALKYAGLQGSGSDASVVGLPGRFNSMIAAIANGMLAHADETDDSHAGSGMHPGCAILPAALAMAEKNRKSGSDLLRAMVLGYDVGPRLMASIGAVPGAPDRRYDTHSFGGTFGAAAAAGALASASLNDTQCRHLLSYAAQQTSGLASYPMDTGHVEKAFIFGGMPARSGMTAATMIETGFTGIDNDLEGANGFLYSRGMEKADAAKLSDALGERFEIMRTNIKKYSVGSPIQAPIDCLANIMRTHRVGPDDFESMVVYTARGEDKITRPDQLMSDLNIRYLLAVTLIDGGLTFRAAHDEARVHQPAIERITKNITIRANPALVSPESPRQGIIEFKTRDGHTFSNHVVKVRGVMENPMSTEEVIAKADDLLRTVMPAERAERATTTVLNIEKLTDVRGLATLFAPE